MAKQTNSWDSPENEASNNFVAWSLPRDFVLGTLIAVREVKSTLPGKEGEMQKIYEVKAKEGTYHTIDDKKKVVEEPVVLSTGDLVSVGGRKTIDSRMARVKIGQIFGLKFVEELPAKQKGFNPTKVIKVFTPRDAAGDFQMDEEFLAEEAEKNGDF